MIEALFACALLLTTTPILLLFMNDLSTYYSSTFINDAKAHQLFVFLQEELNHTQTVQLSSKEVLLTLHNGDLISIKLNGTNIVRQVNGYGQERLVFDVADFQCRQYEHSFSISVTLKGGSPIEKYYTYPPQPKWL